MAKLMTWQAMARMCEQPDAYSSAAAQQALNKLIYEHHGTAVGLSLLGLMPFYVGNLNAAHKLLESGWVTSIYVYTDRWMVEIDTGRKDYTASAPTLALAICKAWLMAKGI